MVAKDMTRTAQQSMVGQGLAVGLLTIGVEATTSAKMAFELAFAKAWRQWQYTPSFRKSTPRSLGTTS